MPKVQFYTKIYNSGKVLCSVFVTILLAWPPSLMEWNYRSKNRYANIGNAGNSGKTQDVTHFLSKRLYSAVADPELQRDAKRR